MSRPDSGWSWVIAFSCCFINAVMFGLSRLSGILLVETRKEFLISRKEASMPYTLAAMMRNLISPFVGVVGQKIGVRRATLAGLFLSFVTVATCFAAQNVTWILIFWGILFGIGYGFGNILLPLVINQYFIKHRATASGISFAGACLGSFFLPPLVDVLVTEYGLKGTYLFASALILQTMPFCLLLRQPDFTITEKTHKRHASPLEENFGAKPHVHHDNETCEASEQSETVVCQLQIHEASSTNSKVTNSVDSIKNGQNQIIAKQAINMPFNVTKHFRSDSNQVHVPSQSIIGKYLRLFRSPIFILILLTTGVFGYTFVCMVTCVVDFGEDVGVHGSESKYILMSFSIGDILGRIGLGWITDHGYMTINNYTALFFGLQGIIAAVFVWSRCFKHLIVAMAIYGLFEGGIILILPVLIANYIDHDLQVLAIPSSNVLVSPGVLLIPIVIGFFRETLGSYDGMFYHVSIMSFIIALLWLYVSYAERHSNKKNRIHC